VAVAAGRPAEAAVAVAGEAGDTPFWIAVSSASEISDAEVLMTIFDGRTVYESAN